MKPCKCAATALSRLRLGLSAGPEEIDVVRELVTVDVVGSVIDVVVVVCVPCRLRSTDWANWLFLVVKVRMIRL